MPESQARSRGLPALLALGAISLAGSHYVNAGAAHDAAAARHAATAQSSVVSPATPPAGTILNTLNAYCVTCHNSRLKTAGLVLDALDVTRVADHAQQWEKVATKLRTGEMPPPGRPRPDSTTSRAVAAALERELDAAAAAHPHPGRVPVHRLNRSEYTNAVRDLLDLEVDARALLPSDEADQEGFDNVASVLSVSPALLENYLSAARIISRMAVGDPTLRPVIDSYKISKALVQDDRVGDDLPFGSRGGALIRYYFPRRRRVLDQSPAATPGVRLHRRHGRAASARFPSRRRAAETILGRRRSEGDDDAGELRREHSGRSRVGGVHAHRRRASRDARAGEGGPSRGRRLFRRAIVGARRHSAAATNWLRTHDQRVLPRQSRSGDRVDRRSLRGSGSWSLDRPPEAVYLRSRRPRRRRSRAPEEFCQPSRRAPIGGQ